VLVPNAAYRHFASRDELLAAVCTAALRELAARMAAGVARVPGKHGDPEAAQNRFHAIGVAYLEFAREEPGCSPPRSPCRNITPTALLTAGPGRSARR
jgi:AcrR family transcriptional regulator